jgi:hypothetical protein
MLSEACPQWNLLDACMEVAVFAGPCWHFFGVLISMSIAFFFTGLNKDLDILASIIYTVSVFD